MKNKIFISREFFGEGIPLLQAQFSNMEIGLGPYPKKKLIEKAKDCEGLVSFLTDTIDEEVINNCPHLKVISNYAVGFNNIDVDYATKKGILVGNTPDVLTKATAELTLSLILNLTRNIQSASKDVQKGNWKTWDPMGHLGPGIMGKKLGIFGMGRIGQEVAKIAYQSFQMEISYTSNGPKELPFLAERVDLETLLETSDVLSVHCDLNPSTKNLFNLQHFQKMKKGSYFINTSRGEIHNENDLLAVLNSKHLRGCALDVTNPEPIGINSPLLKMENVIVTPHIGSATYDTRNQMGLLAARNIINGLLGHPLKALVNPEVLNK